MKIAVNNHQNKANKLIAALEAGGHEITKSPMADVLLIDFDGMVSFYPEMIERYAGMGAKVLVYSHGAMPITAYDGIWEPSDRVSAYLAMTPGQKEVMEAYGYPYPIHVIGWHYCDILPFQACHEPKKVLFAPWHPHENGYLHPDRKWCNVDVFHELRWMGYELTVRHIRTLYQNGLNHVDGVEYVMGHADNSTKEIDEADLVIAEGTFAYLAVARGKPTVMFGQDLIPLDGYRDEMIKKVKSWEKYKDIMRYPYDVKDGALYQVIEAACNSEPVEWKEKLIGTEMDGQEFCLLVEELAGG